MACIGGILVWVASNMIKPSELREVAKHGKFETAIMLFTAVLVPLTDFLTGVLSALCVYGAVHLLGQRRKRSALARAAKAT